MFYKNYVIYNSDYSGIGNIHAVDISTRQTYQITSSRFGAYNAAISPDSDKMVYQEYTKNGFDIAEISLNPSNWKKIEEVVKTEPQYYQSLVEQEGGQTIDEANIPSKIYPVDDYRKIKDGIKLHSWGIFSSIPYIDASVLSNNYLNTLAIRGGYLYNTNEKTHGAYLGFSYSKYFPVFSAFSTILQKKETYILEDTSFSYNWNEFNVTTELSLPFNLSRNVSNTNIEFAAGAEFIKVDGVPQRVYIDEISDGNLTPLYLSFSFSNYRNYAWRDFAPRYGQFLELYYKKIMPYDNYRGHQFSAISGLYFPGLLTNNSLKFGATYEKQLDYDQDNNSDYYFFSKKASFARGYTSVGLSEFYKLSTDYQLPIWSPDLSIGPLAYIRRIRLGGFYDYLKGSFADQQRIYESIGGSIRIEFNVFRIKYPLEIGVQYAYRINDGDYEISFLILGLPI